MVRRVINLAALLLVVLMAVVAVGVFLVRRTVAPDDEQRSVAGLRGPVTIDYDAAGVPTLHADNALDMAFAQGYAHARDRRFQMELFRRNAAGRLAEVVGRAALPLDRRFRRFGFVRVADQGLERMQPERRAKFEAYAAGVNAWDGAHPAPPEFAMLGIRREPWQARDGLLVTLLMYEQLTDAGESEIEVEQMDAALPRALVDFLMPEATPIDVALDGRPAPAPPPLPGPRVANLREGAPPAVAPATAAATHRPSAPQFASGARFDRAWDGERMTGSNNWAIAPSRTASGGALLAGDPHLGLSVPVTWHRQRLEGAGYHITGISLPGLWGIVIGDNGDVAWSFTNVEGDPSDLVRVAIADAETTRYHGPHGDEAFGLRTEIIAIKGGGADTLRVRDTRWGPVIAASVAPEGGLLALQWTGLDPFMCDGDLTGFDQATSVADLIARAGEYRGPPQNVVAADRDGHIGFTVAGLYPARHGYDPRRPREGADANAGWNGYTAPAALTTVIDPPQGFLVTANQRTVAGPARALIGSGFAMPYRAHRIQERLATAAGWTVDSVTALQNDVDDAFLDVAAAALDRALTPEQCEKDTVLARARRILDGWTHRADTTSVAHGWLRMARLELNLALQNPLFAPCIARDSSFTYTWALSDEVSRRLLAERPPHLLDPAFGDYDALVRAVAVRAIARLEARAPGLRAEAIPWGRINRAAIQHPIGRAVPMLARLFNMPTAALAGGSNVVRVASPRSGASMRMAADLARPDRSRFTMPGGQSGNFLSVHYADEFGDWVAGRSGSLEPGTARHHVRLRPAPR